MPLSAATRARLYRKRLRAGVRVVDVAVDAAAVSALERAGLLPEAEQHDPRHVAQAVEKLLGELPRYTALTARPPTAPPVPAVPVPAPPPRQFASVVVAAAGPGLGSQHRRR